MQQAPSSASQGDWNKRSSIMAMSIIDLTDNRDDGSNDNLAPFTEAPSHVPALAKERVCEGATHR